MQAQNEPSTSHTMSSPAQIASRKEPSKMGSIVKGSSNQRERLELKELKSKSGPVFDSFE